VSRATQEQKHISRLYFAYGAITLYGVAFQQLPLYKRFVTHALQAGRFRLTTPDTEASGLGFSRFARRYLGNRESHFPSTRSIKQTENDSLLFSFPLGTEMFHFPR
jgi:hypothetical protein